MILFFKVQFGLLLLTLRQEKLHSYVYSKLILNTDICNIYLQIRPELVCANMGSAVQLVRLALYQVEFSETLFDYYFSFPRHSCDLMKHDL